MAASASIVPELPTVAGLHSTLLQPGAPLVMSCWPQRDLQGCKQPAPICWVQAAAQLWVAHLAAGGLCQQPAVTGLGMLTIQVASLQHLMRCKLDKRIKTIALCICYGNAERCGTALNVQQAAPDTQLLNGCSQLWTPGALCRR